MSTPVAGQVAVGDDLLVRVALVVVLAVLAAVVGCVAGLLHRWYANQRVPDGLPVLVGVSAVAVYLNTAGALGDVLVGEVDLLAVEAAIFNVVTFFVAAGAAYGGGRVGDRIGLNLFAVSGATSVEADVSRLVRTVGRVTTVRLPADATAIDDIDGYDPVDPEVKTKLAGQTLLFPRRLTVDQLRERFVERLRTDYGVGHVDVDFAPDGTVEYLAVGSRESGIGPTLPPGTAAVAVKADPANNASPGDTVQLWTTGGQAPRASAATGGAASGAAAGGANEAARTEGDVGTEGDGGTSPDVAPDAGSRPRRIANGELRGTADDVATLALDEEDAKVLDTERRYRLVTLPVEPRIDREFAAQLRAAAETMSVVTVAEGSPLTGVTVGALDVAVAAVGATDGGIEAIPRRARTLSVGERVYAIGRPDRLRRLEAAATAAGSTTMVTTSSDDDD